MEGLPSLPANTVREINGMAAKSLDANWAPSSAPVVVDLHKLEDAIEQSTKPPEVAAYAPIPERSPELVADSIRKSHDLTACQVELVADQMLEEAKQAHQHAYGTAKAIREYGESEAGRAERSLGFVRENYRLSREQQDRVNQFISGAAQ